MTNRTTPILVAILTLAAGSIPLAAAENAESQRISRSDVVWTTPSANASGAMPIGNGDIAASVYAVADGDLGLLLAKNDAYTWCGDLFKTGRVAISLTPNPFRAGAPFRQTLDLATGSIRIDADGVRLRIWTDANRPVYHIDIESPADLTVTARAVPWKRFDTCTQNQLPNLPAPQAGPTQDVQVVRDGRLLWYYAVGDRSLYPEDLRYYQVEDMASRFPDPYRFNTFGNCLEGDGLAVDGDVLRGTGRTFSLRIHALAMQTPKPETWLQTIAAQAKERRDAAADWTAHAAWWSAFWGRSWITASDRTVPTSERGVLRGEPNAKGLRDEADGAAVVAQNYTVFRYIMACQSRGRVQAKFNGGLFTQQLALARDDNPRLAGATERVGGVTLTHPDERLWGRRFTFQNQRLLYWPLLMSGDHDLMQPFFRYYADLLPMRTAITKAWFGHEGAYFRDNIEPTGAERDCGKDGKPSRDAKPGRPAIYYHDYYFTSGLETVTMMLDRVEYTGDIDFRDRILAPHAREVLRFFSAHYPRVDGKLRLDPAQVLETFWIAVNPTPEIAGLRFCIDRLLTLGVGTEADRATWSALRAEIPAIPMRTVDGMRVIANAESYELKKNYENGDLYAVFPFRCFGYDDRDLIRDTMRHRVSRDVNDGGCWSQDQIDWAIAGAAKEAASGLVHRFRTASTMCRFPIYGRQGPDSCPDFDHHGSGATALQRMLVQEHAGRIHLLPAWPATWDSEFRLHLSRGTVVEGRIAEGKLTTWSITPEARRAEVVVHEPQAW